MFFDIKITSSRKTFVNTGLLVIHIFDKKIHTTISITLSPISGASNSQL